MSVREASFAGSFYPGDASELRRRLRALVPPEPRAPALAVIVPHAGYPYSGRVAGAVYGRVEVPRDVVLLCFNHGHRGEEFAVWPEGEWRTPLGPVPVNAGLAGRIRDSCPGVVFDEEAHREEHSGEVQLPFLQHVRPDVRVVPLALSVSLSAPSCRRLQAVGRALAGVEGDFLVVASTDLNHFEDQATTLEKDGAVIRAMERLDEAGLRAAILERNVSMCGYGPVLAALAYAKAKGAVSARTVVHATSGEVTGDFDRVVGYVGMIVPCGSSSGPTAAGN